MRLYTTVMVAKMLGINRATLYRYIAANKIVAPRAEVIDGRFHIRLWSDRDVARVRKQIKKAANGRRKGRKK